MKWLNKMQAFNLISPVSWLSLLLLVCSYQVKAEPYLALKTGLKCGTCHVNPLGGGQRTMFGNIYGATQLVEKPLSFNAAEMGKINDYLSLGGNLRYNAEVGDDDAGNKTTGFRVDSGQIYMTATSADNKLTFYLDQQVAPGSALNREAFIMYRVSPTAYVKAGKMFVPVGLRIEDDTSFIRQVSGFNFDSSDNGVEVGLDYGSTTVNLFVTNGTSAVSNNDDKVLVGGRVEHLFTNFRLGSTLLFNDAEQNAQTLANMYGGLKWRDFAILAELDWINTEQLTGDDISQLIGLFEVNYQWQQGWNVKFTSEFYDPNLDVDEDQETRYSLLGEYAPFSGLQLRGGLRVASSIPQKPERSSNLLFLQAHLYF